MKILVAEDDPISRNLIEKMLSRYGTCTVTENGIEALAAFDKALQDGEPFQLVCLDIMMPGMDGLACLKSMRASEKEKGGAEAKIVMTTAVDTMKSVMDAYYHGGCNAYLVKPIEPQTLQSTLRDCKLIP